MAIPRSRSRLILAAVVLASVCAGAGQRGPVGASDSTPAPDAAACPIIPYAAEVLDPSFSATWYHSGDLWSAPYGGDLGAWYAEPEWAKVQWRRPIGTALTVEGRRLDGPAPPISAEESDGYDRSEYTFTPLTFPTAGCWEVSGRIPGAELRYVVFVHPGEEYYRTTPPPTATPDLWQTLHRPLTTIVFGPDGACPATQGTEIDRVAGTAYGDGPVYVQGLDGSDGLTMGDDGTVSLRWILSPDAPPWLLVRGVPVDGVQPTFGGDDSLPETHLVPRLSPGTRDWQIRPERLSIPGPGCYALQIDAPEFTQAIVLEIGA